jgi:lipid-A-disaccharide synthase
MPGSDLLVVAGEASGDQHGARLLAELRRLDPDLQAFGLGGDELQAAGMALVARSEEISVVGLAEVIRVLPRAREIFRLILAELDRRRATSALLIDFPDFNLRLAQELKRRGVRVVYYISPQVWAWRKGRVKTIARVVDRMLVLFPFEVDFYRRHGVEAVHVGHPLVDEVAPRPQAWDRPVAGEPARIALLPGSRSSEVRALLPAMLGSLPAIAARREIAARVIVAPPVRELVGELAASAPVPVELVTSARFDAIADSHLALCASGTATLEVGLLGTPMIVLYRLHAWTYRLARWLVDLPYFSLVNLVLGRPAVPELLQAQASPGGIAAEALALLGDPGRIAAMRAELADLRHALGEGGGSARAAREVLAALRTQVPA